MMTSGQAIAEQIPQGVENQIRDKKGREQEEIQDTGAH